MNDEIRDRRKLLAIGAAAVLAAGAGGIFIGQSMSGGPPAEEHAEGEEHGEGEAGEEGFVALTAEEARAAGVEVTTVSRTGGGELIVPGRVAFAPNAETQVGAPLAGIVEAVHVAPGAQVGAGRALATLRSTEGAALRASADAARAEAEAANAAYRREVRLFEERVTARQDLEAARAANLKAAANLRAANAQIAAVGAPAVNGRLVVRAPIAGTVTTLAAAPGAFLAQGAPVAQVANQGRVELVFDAPAAASQAIRIGAEIRATTADGREVPAIVTAVLPNAADAGAQVRARATGFVPPAGTPVSGRLLTGAGGQLAVPSDAVQTVEGRPVVFIAEGRGFRARPVVPGRIAAGRTEIVRGLNDGERIAGRGAFLLKAELSRGEAEHEH
jgi:membrane fusion protein, heavy metal efflux system